MTLGAEKSVLYSVSKVCLRVPGWLNELVVGLPNNSYKPITYTAWVCARLCKL
jgi:hypothetical protein